MQYDENIKCYVISYAHILDDKTEYWMFWLKTKEASISSESHIK